MGAIPASGIAELGPIDLLTLPPHLRVAPGVGYMPEDRRLVPEFTVEENVRLPALSLKMSGADRRLNWIFELIPEVAHFRARSSLELSGGQQKMVALARALMAGTRMLLLDEPFEGLAPALARRLGELLANLKTEGVSILIAESNEVHVVDLLSRAFSNRARIRECCLTACVGGVRPIRWVAKLLSGFVTARHLRHGLPAVASGAVDSNAST
jgi:branched-chain amino acid transport system ATP-binding protein